MGLAGHYSLVSREINFSQYTRALDSLFETILLTDKHDRSLESAMTRNDSVRFVPRATVTQRCKERRTSRAVCEHVPKLGRDNMRCALCIGRAYVDDPFFRIELTAISRSIGVRTTSRGMRSE